MMLSIEQVSYFMPKTRLKIEESLERFSLTKSQARVFSAFYGLQEIPCAEGMSMVELISQSVEALLQKTNVDKHNIKYIIHSHTAKVITRFGRSVIREVQQALGLGSTIAFGTSLNNCASTLNAFDMAKVLLHSHDEHARAIVVTGERAFTPSVQVIPNTSITGDASAAVLVGLHGKNHRLLHQEMNTAGEFHRGIWLTPEESKLFGKKYVPLLSETILSAIKKAGLTMDDIRLILPHNVNLISWENTAKAMNFPLDKIYLKNVKKYAHCFGADIFINFADALAEEKLKVGDYYVMATVGLGATFAAAVFQY
jgi:3-oxoacyl-[acyl-carrier-protein] synthase-3